MRPALAGIRPAHISNMPLVSIVLQFWIGIAQRRIENQLLPSSTGVTLASCKHIDFSA
ncbi:hypothetical protein P3T43_007146 [Paraburkholderia sp. GAS41]|jgi:hypothetical protein